MKEQLCFKLENCLPSQKNNRQTVSWTLPDETKEYKLKTLSLQQKKEKLFDNRIHKFLSTKEASGFLGVSQNALRILVCRKKVKAYKLGNRLKFKFSDLMDCLQQKEV